MCGYIIVIMSCVSYRYVSKVLLMCTMTSHPEVPSMERYNYMMHDNYMMHATKLNYMMHDNLHINYIASYNITIDQG